MTQRSDSCRKTFWILLLIFGRKHCPEFPEQLIIGVLGFLGTQLCVLCGLPISRAEILFPQSIKATELPKSADLRAEAATGTAEKSWWCETTCAGGTPPGPLRGGICSPPSLQSISWGVCFSPYHGCGVSHEGAVPLVFHLLHRSEGCAERPQQCMRLGMWLEGPRQEGVPSSSYVVVMQVNLCFEFFILMELQDCRAALQCFPCASWHEPVMRFHSVLLFALEFTWRGLSKSFPFAKIYVKMMPCAIMRLSWNLQRIWLGKERKAWLGTVICPCQQPPG